MRLDERAGGFELRGVHMRGIKPEVDLPGDPQTITTGLSQKPAHPVFVSTTRPSAACEDNPLGEELEDRTGAGGTRKDAYDGYIHYGALTSERNPSDTTYSRDSGMVAKLRAFRASLERNERAAKASGALGRMGRIGKVAR